MASADNNHRLAAVMRALDMPSRMPPNARLWLALASSKSDHEGRTSYTADGYSIDAHDSINSGASAIAWLNDNGLVLHDVDDDGKPCYRLAHYDHWDQDRATIGGYSRDAGQKRDGLPPMYGRSVSDVIDPPTGKQNFQVPTWDQIAPTIQGGQQ